MAASLKRFTSFPSTANVLNVVVPKNSIFNLFSSSNHSVKKEDDKQKPTEKEFPHRIFSGIQPTGIPHLGNYFGAIKPWVEYQNHGKNIIISIVDMHAITMKHDAATLRDNIFKMTASLIACGIDPAKTILFRQSDVLQHAALAWVLGCLTTMPRLSHLPQYKTKTEGQTEIPLGIFTYPVLQTADILLYKATDVPVGEDQVQHIQLAQDLARIFNHNFGEVFPRPRSLMSDVPKLFSLRKPSQKMSKSDPNSKSRIELTDSPDEIRSKFKKAVTDTTSHVTYDPVLRPGISNLIEIHCAVADISPEMVQEDCFLQAADSGSYKTRVAELVIEYLKPIQRKIVQLEKDRSFLEKTLLEGSTKATEIASQTYKEVQQAVGFV